MSDGYNDELLKVTNDYGKFYSKGDECEEEVGDLTDQLVKILQEGKIKTFDKNTAELLSSVSKKCITVSDYLKNQIKDKESLKAYVKEALVQYDIDDDKELFLATLKEVLKDD